MRTSTRSSTRPNSRSFTGSTLAVVALVIAAGERTRFG